MTMPRSEMETVETGPASGLVVEAFERDGFAFPVRAFEAADIDHLRGRIEAELLPRWGDPTQETDYTFQTHLLFPWLDAVVRHEPILEAVSRLLGSDLLLWNSGFVVKPPRNGYFASWHQDLLYWGLEPHETVTAWLAFTESTVDNGCVRCIPGTHRGGLLPATETFANHNMLSRGQTLDVPEAEAWAVNLVLRPGEFSLHHGLTVHSSNPNRSASARIGMTMTFIRPEVRSTKGRDTATLVRGRDHYRHFELNPRPSGDLDPAAVAVHAAASQRRAAVIDAASPKHCARSRSRRET